MISKKLIATGVAACAVLALVGCSSGTAQPSRPLPEKNIKLWTMPLDQYVYSYSVEADYAENLLTEPCMQKKGFDFPVPWRNLDALHSESYNDVGVRLFDPALAAKWGYHTAVNDDPSAEAWRAVVSKMTNITPAEDEALVSCLKVARKTVPVLPLEAQNATGLVNDTVVSAKQQQPVKDAIGRWKQCMQPLGIADLPDTPDDMPTPSLMKTFGLLGDGGSPTASPDEISIATADAGCQDSSGYKRALYEAEWKNQVAVITSHSDELTRVYDMLKTHKAKVLTVIADHAPEH